MELRRNPAKPNKSPPCKYTIVFTLSVTSELFWCAIKTGNQHVLRQWKKTINAFVISMKT